MDRRIVMDKAVVEVGLAFDNIVADNIEAVDHMVVNIGAVDHMVVNIEAGSIVIGNIVDIGIDNHSQSLDILLGIRIRSLKDSHHILVGHNYIDKSRCFAPPYWIYYYLCLLMISQENRI
ncbi:hypothetical protein [[Eubacterium] cellulosolvens]